MKINCSLLSRQLPNAESNMPTDCLQDWKGRKACSRLLPVQLALYVAKSEQLKDATRSLPAMISSIEIELSFRLADLRSRL